MTAELQRIEIPGEHVQLWAASLDRPPDRFARHLSEPERARAERYRREQIRDRFIVGRGLLRELLGEILGITPGEVPITSEPDGKPMLTGEFAACHFNVSHSEGVAVYAVAQGRRVGVDVEQVRDIPNMVNLVERFFATAECEAFRRLPGLEQRDAFFNGWTRKESLIKARGESVQMLDRFEVSLTGEPRLLRHADCPGEERRWAMWGRDLEGDFRVCVAEELIADC